MWGQRRNQYSLFNHAVLALEKEEMASRHLLSKSSSLKPLSTAQQVYTRSAGQRDRKPEVLTWAGFTHPTRNPPGKLCPLRAPSTKPHSCGILEPKALKWLRNVQEKYFITDPKPSQPLCHKKEREGGVVPLPSATQHDAHVSGLLQGLCRAAAAGRGPRCAPGSVPEEMWPTPLSGQAQPATAWNLALA